MFGVIWTMTVLGIVIYATKGNKMRFFSAITYIVMGWIIVFLFPVLWKSIPRTSFAFLLSGGLAYTMGCPFYMLKKIKWTHYIFHLFCLFGSVLHFFAVFFMFL